MNKKDLTYDMFIEKFKPKKTTDDCYTPPQVYDVIADWVCSEYGVNKENFVRPFYPGGDYENYEYKPTDIVVDNPPFSIEAQILNFYLERGIKFFLFAPALTLFSSASAKSCCALCVRANITYDNGAKVPTSFVTNLEDTAVRSAPSLKRIIENLNLKKNLPKYKYPPEVLTAFKINYLSEHGVDFRLSRNDLLGIDRLDNQRKFKKAIFGHGYLLSLKAAEELQRAEADAKAKAEADAEKAIIWGLSEREHEIINSLGGHHD